MQRHYYNGEKEKMNRYEDIIESWRIAELMSDGVLPSMKEMKDVCVPLDATAVLKQERAKMKKDRSLALFFGTFQEKEMMETLAIRFSKKDYMDASENSLMYSFSLELTEDMKLVENSIFVTAAMFGRRKNRLPESEEEFSTFRKHEEQKIASIVMLFRDKRPDAALDGIIQQLCVEYGIMPCSCMATVCKAGRSRQLHSFFAQDLEKAKTSESETLKRYIEGNSKKGFNLDVKGKDRQQAFHILDGILQPCRLPLGRFLDPVEYAPAFMQQVAVNVAISQKDGDVQGVNGPPGTGKTSLLKDVFADIIVRQSRNICRLKSMKLPHKEGEMAEVPASIASDSIIIASSNNGAIANITSELPLMSKIGKEFADYALEVDYFSSIAESSLNKKKGKNEKRLSAWGLISMQAGKTEFRKDVAEAMKMAAGCKNNTDSNIRNRFLKETEAMKKMRMEMQKQADMPLKIRQEKERKEELKDGLLRTDQEIRGLESDKTETERRITALHSEIEREKDRRHDMEITMPKKPGWLSSKQRKEEYEEAKNRLQETDAIIEEKEKAVRKAEKEWKRLASAIGRKKREAEETENDIERCEGKIRKLMRTANSSIISRAPDYSQDYDSLQKSSPWSSAEYRMRQSHLMLTALAVRKTFVLENADSVRIAAEIISGERKARLPERRKAYQWMSVVIPVIGTTFASAGKMFWGLSDTDLIGHLFIDEAGQALPYAAAGLLMRSRKVLAVGDPSQIPPVLGASEESLALIREGLNVSEEYLSEKSSVQTLADAAGTYGYQKNKDEWIGIPLWVHRRCMSPMFDISNRVSYDGCMVQAKEGLGKAEWMDIGGKSENKFVIEQATALQKEIDRRLAENPAMAKDIFVISPFRNVVAGLKKKLHGIDKKNIGTVHTFQGKEADIVYLVLGTDKNEKNAARWAVGNSNPNIMNVAATRAKKEFYIVGDRKLFESLGSKVVSETLAVIDKYSKK